MLLGKLDTTPLTFPKNCKYGNQVVDMHLHDTVDPFIAVPCIANIVTWEAETTWLFAMPAIRRIPLEFLKKDYWGSSHRPLFR